MEGVFIIKRRENNDRRMSFEKIKWEKERELDEGLFFLSCYLNEGLGYYNDYPDAEFNKRS